MHCIVCGRDYALEMHSIRLEERPECVLGWVFVCKKCEGKELKFAWEVKDE